MPEATSRPFRAWDQDPAAASEPFPYPPARQRLPGRAHLEVP